MYLEVKDPKWAAAVEFATTGGLLNSFCVDNHQDSQLLRYILGKYYQKPPAIIVSQYESQMFDVQHGRVQSAFPSVLDMLIIKNYLVANCLIDQAQIEKKILVEDETAGAGLMRNPPNNCYSAYFMNCDQICFNPSRLYSYGKRIPRSRLSAIRAEDVKNLENDKEEKMARIKQLSERIETLMNAKESLPEKIGKLERDVVKISTEYEKNLRAIKELQCKEETKDVNCLQEDLQPLYHSYEQKKEEIKQQSQLLSELESKKLDLERKIDTLSAQLKSLDEDFQRLHTKISRISKLKENFASGKKKYETELKYKENEYKTDQKVLEDLQSKLDIMRARAESTCPRINTERSSEDISRLIEETKRVVEAQSNCGGENLIEKYKEKLDNLRRAEMDLKRIEKHLIRIGEMLKVRNANFQKIRKNTELLIGLTFTTILSGNGYTGHLIFDQTNRTLTMDVSTRASDRTRKNHSSLSGGERSFVTIAFLLALWERTKMPFRILDEYDVFMLLVIRKILLVPLCLKNFLISLSVTKFHINYKFIRKDD
ncbi:Structural maintenance of chromosomes protein 6 [Araneus ventricosus]|uniref:Structural maintenance of chromosomes protein 6 n=1 Tax=Araneus ventricosus TaxID=182803 RepID=A0A4Y2A8I7_ARAVE|nr:Structural maintenance of chromosomes protein 6 [Araneus ventricosus]